MVCASWGSTAAPTYYSAPWFGDRRVLKGGSWATNRSLLRTTYRNYFEPHRNDIFAGFRTCACT